MRARMPGTESQLMGAAGAAAPKPGTGMNSERTNKTGDFIGEEWGRNWPAIISRRGRWEQRRQAKRAGVRRPLPEERPRDRHAARAVAAARISPHLPDPCP